MPIYKAEAVITGRKEIRCKASNEAEANGIFTQMIIQIEDDFKNDCKAEGFEFGTMEHQYLEEVD